MPAPLTFLTLLAVLTCLPAFGFQTATYLLETILGAEMPESIPALDWNFNELIYPMALDRDGVLWFMEGGKIRKLTPDGKLRSVPVQGSLENVCGNGPWLDPFYSLAIGPDGLLYVSDPFCHVIRRIHSDGSQEIFAGRLVPGPAGNGGPAKDATLGQVQTICFDRDGNLYLLERSSGTVRKVNTSGMISVAADLNASSAGPAGLGVWGVAVSRQGEIYVSERFAPYRIVKFSSSGAMSVFAVGTGYQFDLAFDAAGNLYVRGGADLPTVRFTPEGKGSAIPNTANYAVGMAVDPAGNIYFGDARYSISVADPQGRVRRVAGTGKTALQAGVAQYALLTSSSGSASVEGILTPGDDGSMWIGSQSGLYMLHGSGKLERLLSVPAYNLIADSAGNVYYTSGNSVWKLDSTQNGARVVVIPQTLYPPSSLAVDAQRNLYVAYYGSASYVERLDYQTGSRSIFAGTGDLADLGDGGPASSAQFRYVSSLAMSRSGELMIGDLNAARVRKVDQAGKITSITGTGIVGSGGEDLPAFGLPAGGISGVAADLMHNLYVGECRNVVGRIRMIDQQGYIRTIAGGWTNVDARDQAGPLKARLGCPSEMKVAADGTVYFIDGFRSVRRLVPEVTRFPRVAQGGALHGATFLPGPVSPGMLLTVFGSNLGRASIDRTGISSGRLGTVAGATAVLFDGVPAPMVYSTEGQLAVMAPYSLRAGGKTRIAVNIDHAQSTPIELDVAAARPGIFTADSSGRGQAAMLNQDGSVNSAGNPAAPGSIVVLFGTGEGQTAPPVLDGTINNGPAFPKPVLPVGVLMCGEPAEILYGGAAPASPAGILQVNARIPESCRNTRNAEIRLRVGDFLSPAGVTVAIKTD